MESKKNLYLILVGLVLVFGYVYVDKFHPNLFSMGTEESLPAENLNAEEPSEEISEDKHQEISVPEAPVAPKIEEKEEFPKRDSGLDKRSEKKRIHRRVR